jgi:carbon storage regulator
MLILTRKSQESVVVGDSGGLDQMLKVTVLDIRGRFVRLGFEAGRDVPIHRWEVWERMRDGGRSESLSDRPSDAAVEAFES